MKQSMILSVYEQICLKKSNFPSNQPGVEGGEGIGMADLRGKSDLVNLRINQPVQLGRGGLNRTDRFKGKLDWSIYPQNN